MNSAQLPAIPLPSSLDGVYFVTLRLSDALPESFGQNLGLQYYLKQLEMAQHRHRAELLLNVRKQLFKRFDEALDLGKYGQARLLHPPLAQIAADRIRQLDGNAYDLLTYVMLPNHIHLLLDLHTRIAGTPNALDIELIDYKPLRTAIIQLQSTLEKSLKTEFWQLEAASPPTTFHKYQPNGKIQVQGKIWHERSFDFQISSAAEFGNCIRYMFQNPVYAALVASWQDWPFFYWKK